MKEQQKPEAAAPGKLPGAVQQRMETAFGRSFADVNVHVGGEASAVGAHAFARGKDIHFAPGRFDPESTSGLELIGHELAHVVQQAEGRVAATTQHRGVTANEDCSLEEEADRAGAAAARGERVTLTSGRADHPSIEPVVQGKFVLPAGEGPRPSWEDPNQGLHVSNDGSLAVHPGAKTFGATLQRVAESNALLAAVKSEFQLKPVGGAEKFVGLDGAEQSLVQVVGENTKESTSGPNLSGPIRCNEMAAAVSGPKQTAHASTTGIMQTGAKNFGLDLATYATDYATSRDHAHATGAVDSRQKDIATAPQSRIEKDGYVLTVKPGKKVSPLTLGQKLRAIIETSGGALRPSGQDDKQRPQVATEDKDLGKSLLKPLIDDGTCGGIKSRSAKLVVGVDTSAAENVDKRDAKAFASMSPKDRERVASELRLDQYAEPDIGEAYGIFPAQPMSSRDERGFPYHQAGVVAKAGADTVTLENFFTSSRTEQSVFFNLYGPLENAKVEASGQIKSQPTSDKQRAKGSFHGTWQENFDGSSPVTTSLGTSHRAEHPGAVPNRTDAAPGAASLFVYWLQRWGQRHDAQIAKQAIAEIEGCSTAINAAIDRGLVPVDDYKRLMQELRTPATAPKLAAWHAGPLVERPRHGEPEKHPDNNNVKDEPKRPTTRYDESTFDEAWNEFLYEQRRNGPETKELAKRALEILNALGTRLFHAYGPDKYAHILEVLAKAQN